VLPEDIFTVFVRLGFSKYEASAYATLCACGKMKMGVLTGISDSYYRPTEKEHLEDYLKAVPLLTVSEAEEVRRESQLSRQQLEERLGQLEDLVSQLVTEKGEQVLSQGPNRNEGTSKKDSSRKVVRVDEIEKVIDEGWEPMMTLPDGRVIVKIAASPL